MARKNTTVSCIVTVKNEERSIQRLMDALLAQSRTPQEIIFADGGSTDNTREVLRQYRPECKRRNIVLKITTKKGNRSVGRNIAIEKAESEYIAVTDGGCIPDEEWLKRLVVHAYRHPNIDVVSGYYFPQDPTEEATVFQKCVAAYTSVMPDQLDVNTYLPSSRSVLFKKSAWKAVGGYPEELDTCEDLMFARHLKEKEKQFMTVPDAIVYWPQVKSLSAFIKQIYGYAYGDGQAQYFRPQTPLLYGRYIIGIGLLIATMFFPWMMYVIGIGLLLYVVWAIAKNYRYVRDTRAFLILPILQITSDVAVMIGMIIGMVSRIR